MQDLRASGLAHTNQITRQCCASQKAMEQISNDNPMEDVFLPGTPRELEKQKCTRPVLGSLEGEAGEEKMLHLLLVHRKSPFQNLECGACQGRLTDEVTPGFNQVEGFVKEVERRTWLHGTFSDPAIHSTWQGNTGQDESGEK